MQKGGKYSVKKIIKVEVVDRTEAQHFYLRMHLKIHVPFFANYEGVTLHNICNHLKQKVFDRGDVIVQKGEMGEEMYVILLGEVGVYFDDELQNCVVSLGENKVFGERSLQNSEERTANIVAHKVTVCLVLSKSDFNEQVFHIEHLQKVYR